MTEIPCQIHATSSNQTKEFRTSADTRWSVFPPLLHTMFNLRALCWCSRVAAGRVPLLHPCGLLRVRVCHRVLAPVGRPNYGKTKASACALAKGKGPDA